MSHDPGRQPVHHEELESWALVRPGCKLGGIHVTCPKQVKRMNEPKLLHLTAAPTSMMDTWASKTIAPRVCYPSHLQTLGNTP